MKQVFYIIILISFSRQVFAQTFKTDWQTFSNKNWVISFNSDTKVSFANKNTFGQLFFTNKADNSIGLTYDVYLKSDLDSVFFKKVMDWYFIQSCATWTNSNKSFYSFDFKSFYYLLKPCHNCHTATNKDCEDLAEQLFKLYSTK